ncbi:nucleoside-diphosphate kinase [Duncaniella freteri]|uniref:nucleoside-diphosphate kinase n=2 Tax=Duncaniella TaxID=2518495 RepID=UPI001368106B|nr:nucleoside-diphosphate kinase [Duncaniella freteri]NBJ05730.1 nucleoside-diphosphate kinase [Alistipes sp. Z76]NCE67739.1 nucleoside-diphosphate kinase [Muribaculaceae bacterium M3]
MQQTLIIFKPSAVERGLVGTVLARFEAKGLAITGMKMMQLSPEILREHYAHLVDRPFFPSIVASMTASPVIVMCLKGVDAIRVVRSMTGDTNGRTAAPGSIRGDFSMSNQENIIHASSSVEDAEVEIKRFFSPDELFDYTLDAIRFINADSELKD